MLRKKFSEKVQKEIQKAVILLRFRTTEPTITSVKYMPYLKISSILGVTYN